MSEYVKKRKWDQDDPIKESTSKNPKLETVEKDPSKAVSEAAARINAMLAQKGIPLHTKDSSSDPNSPTHSPGSLFKVSLTKNENEFIRDIPINDLKNRYILTRGLTQTQIHDETGADVTTRGKYYPDPQLATDKEPPLYLHISASNKDSFDKAIARIEELIETAQLPAPGNTPKDEKVDTLKRPERKYHERKLYVDITGPTHFNLRAKIVGPNGAFVKHIQQKTGSRIQLKGKGSGFYEAATGVESDEPLHMQISCAWEEGLEAAVKLAQNLLDTVRAEAERGPPQNHYSYGRGGYYQGRGGYNGHHPNYQPATATATATSTTATSTTATDPYDYSQYYNAYYSQGQPYPYDPTYYNYYGYPNTADPSYTATTSPPPPPNTSLPPPPPPPPSS